jgi:hypothetical protein
VQNIGSLGSARHETDEERFQDLISSWAKLAIKQAILDEEELREMERIATVDDQGLANLPTSRDDRHGIRHRQLKREAVEGLRRFFVTSNGLMGMAPPHVQEGDLACVLLGAQVPFLLRRGNGFTLSLERYTSVTVTCTGEQLMRWKLASLKFRNSRFDEAGLLRRWLVGWTEWLPTYDRPQQRYHHCSMATASMALEELETIKPQTALRLMAGGGN